MIVLAFRLAWACARLLLFLSWVAGRLIGWLLVFFVMRARNAGVAEQPHGRRIRDRSGP